MITLVLIFSILLLFPISVYLFSKAEQESHYMKKAASQHSLDEDPVFISTVQEGKVQETWCYVNDFRSKLKHANIALTSTPASLDHFFNQ